MEQEHEAEERENASMKSAGKANEEPKVKVEVAADTVPVEVLGSVVHADVPSSLDGDECIDGVCDDFIEF